MDKESIKKGISMTQLTMAQAARLLGWTSQRLWYQVKKRRVPGITVSNGVRYFDKEQLLAWKPKDNRLAHGRSSKYA